MIFFLRVQYTKDQISPIILTSNNRCMPSPALESLNILEEIKYTYIYIDTNTPKKEDNNKIELAVRYFLLKRNMADAKPSSGTM